MDEVEFAQLEQRLRRSAVGHGPSAPDALVGFIATVPVGYRPRRRIEVVLGGPRVRCSVFAVAAAVAVVFAIAAGAVLVSIRNDRGVGGLGGDPGAPSLAGWSWQRADGTRVHRIQQVTYGYLGLCGGNPDEALCTSPDGLHWAAPADPRIVVLEGDQRSLPDSISRSGDVYVATGQSFSPSTASCGPDSLPSDCNPTTVMWRSTDGLHWGRVDSPAFSGLTLTYVAGVAGGFVAVAASTPDETGWALTSSDGSTWTRASRLPVQPGSVGGGAAGVYVGSNATEGEWRSLDGIDWTRLTTPAGLGVRDAYAIPGGGFVGLGAQQNGTGYQILTSEDGVTWRVDPGNLQGVPLGLVDVGGRLFASLSNSPLNSSFYPDSSTFASNAFAIWQSADWGRTWQPLPDASGHQMSGMLGTLGDRLTISSPDLATTGWRIAWVGTPPGLAAMTPAPPVATEPPATATPSAEAPEPTPPVTPSAGISQADAIRIAAAALASVPNVPSDITAQLEAGQTTLVYGDPVSLQAQHRWVWTVSYGEAAPTGSGGTVVVDDLTGEVLDMTSWTPS